MRRGRWRPQRHHRRRGFGERSPRLSRRRGGWGSNPPHPRPHHRSGHPHGRRRTGGSACPGPTREGGGETLALQRLGEVVVHPGGETPLAIAGHRVGGEGDDRRPPVRPRLLLQPANLRGRRVAVHLWHLAVHQDRVDPPLFPRRHRPNAVRHRDDLVTQPFQRLHRHHLVHHVVLGQKDAQAPGGGPGRRRHNRRQRCGGQIAEQNLHHRVEELRSPHRLEEHGGEAGRTEGLLLATPIHRGKEDPAGGGQKGIGLDLPPQGVAVHFRHLHVEEGEAERATTGAGVAQEIQRRGAAGRLAHLHPPAGQVVADHLAVGGVVVHHQHGQPGEVLGWPLHRSLAHPQTEGEGKGGARTLGTHYLEVAPHPVHQPLADRQPEAGPSEAAGGRGVRLAEGVEEAGPRLVADPNPRVAHRKADRHPVALFGGEVNTQGDLTPLGELHRVAQEVEKDLAQPPRIAHHPAGDRLAHVDNQLDPLLRGAPRHQGRHPLGALAQVKGDLLEGELARLDLGEVEDVVEDREERLAARPDGLRVAPLLESEVGIEEDLHHPEHAVHRGANLVAHVGEELALRPACRLRRLQGVAQLGGALGHLRLQSRLQVVELAGRRLPPFDTAVEGRLQQGDLAAAPLDHPHRQVAVTHPPGRRGERAQGTAEAIGEDKGGEDAGYPHGDKQQGELVLQLVHPRQGLVAIPA